MMADTSSSKYEQGYWYAASILPSSGAGEAASFVALLGFEDLPTVRLVLLQ
jgi:hypothetical protein